MKRILRARSVILALGLVALPLGVQGASAEENGLGEVEAHWDMLNKYCTECHNF